MHPLLFQFVLFGGVLNPNYNTIALTKPTSANRIAISLRNVTPTFISLEKNKQQRGQLYDLFEPKDHAINNQNIKNFLISNKTQCLELFSNNKS